MLKIAGEEVRAFYAAASARYPNWYLDELNVSADGEASTDDFDPETVSVLRIENGLFFKSDDIDEPAQEWAAVIRRWRREQSHTQIILTVPRTKAKELEKACKALIAAHK